MGLSSDLISQFVKSNKETKTNNKNGTLIQGTAKVKSSGDIFVVMDGSTIETPATTTTSVKDGERVLVTIKNHSAIITGNITSPSSSVLRLVDEFGNEINRITIDTLNADVANVKERLNANEINVNNLKANSVTTKELTTNYLKADDIESKYATIESLNASTGKIYKLESAYGDIDQLIFTNASGEIIQTGFSNAIIAHVGDAQIKSAMIESVSASKITAGDIITNNVRVKSEDGKLVISDETLQISDSSRVRVQIGKDASGDYSINIWDQNGNLMFSKGGITDAAIKEAIIRNDMVSDTANISAYKLDIDSLFEEINDSSNTIKSTKVYLDEEKQTLDVAFKSLTTEVTEQGETISSQGTAISTIQGQISSKVWQQDIDTATDEMTTKYSTLEQEVDSFKTTVSETYATVEDVDSISVGGRNLLLYSNEKKLAMHDGSTSIAEKNISVTEWNATDAIHISGTGGTAPIFGILGGTSNQMAASSNEYYAISVYIKNIHATNKVVVTANHITADSVTVNPGEITRVEIAGKGNGWGYPQINFKTEAAGKEFDFIYWHPKIEKGNIPTDWSPAPEDVSDQIISNRTLIEQTATDLTIKIESAAKTATNYLNFSSSGLVIGDMTASTLGKNVLIDSDSVDIRNGTTTLASFGADYLYLAKNSRDAKIDLCNGLAQMYHEIDDKGYSLFNIDTTYALSYIKMSAPMHDLLVLENTATTNGVIIKGMINGTTVGGFGLVRDGYMVRYGGDADEDNPVENIILDTGNFLTEMDDGWHYTGGYAENFTQYNNETHSQVRYRKIGGVVEVRGALKATTTIEGSDTKHTMFTLPEGYRPDCRIVQRCQGSGMHTWMLTVEESGAVTFSRYGVGTSYSDIGTTVWLPIQITFLVN